jgi:selenide,water dikinase
MRQAASITQDLVLVGGGHAHVHVLKSFAMRPVPGVRVTLVARDVETPYSGMLPGWVAGRYRFDECHIDLGRLVRFAGARLVHDEAIGIDRAAGHLLCRAHPPIRWDLLSLDIGSAPRAHDVPGAAEHTVAVKPIARFTGRWEALLERARHLPRLRLAIIGGGAGGIELTLAAHHRLSGLVAELEVTLVTADTLLPTHNPRVAARLARILAARGIAVETKAPVARVEPGTLCCADGRRIAFDEALWVTEAAAAPWLTATGLLLSPDGFVAIDESLRSPADPRIFAAGDVATMPAHPREKAGVYAVRQGPPLARNLRRALAGQTLRRAVPQRRGLALIGTGDGRAVASRGPFTAEGAGWWRLKDWIDRRWMRRYRELPKMAAEPGAEPMRCGGCAAKVPAAVLGRVIDRLRPMAGDAVAIGLDRPDDAALISLPGAPPLLQSVDFFRAMVTDPYLFGRIAATHALNDIYAMGGRPDTALAVATLPPSRPAIVEHDLFHMLQGALDVLEPAGAALVGGHSAEGAELALGFAVTGRATGRLLRKGGLRGGERLVLTKPLGTGVILAADGQGLAPAKAVAGAIAAMLQPAAAAAACLVAHGATACTDVTGFGLIGHLLEMLRASGCDAVLDPDAIPTLDGALPLLARGITSSLHPDNLAALSAFDPIAQEHPIAPLLIDPQTAGGLLAGLPSDRAGQCLAELRRLGCRAALIGRVETSSGAEPRIALEIGAAEVLSEPVVAS